MTGHASALWHPFTQHARTDAPLFVERAEGATLLTKDGRRIIDGISSWWVNIYGHNHPAIVEAVKAQAEKLDQVIFAGFTHAPAEELAASLTALMPPALHHVFLSDSGSTAVEVALKMALGAHIHRGKPRRMIAAFQHGYHGDTFGAMAAGAPSVFNEIYAPWLFRVERLPFPEAGREEQTVEAFRTLLKEHENDVAALIVEPLVLGAGGMRMYSPTVLRDLKRLCEAHGVYLIADEVMTGFGRTGTLLASQQADIVPDILCLSKGLTGGMLPLGATLCGDDIYQAFYSSDRNKTFWHSSSYTGNPLSCAAACASLKLWQTDETQKNIARLCKAQEEHLGAIAAHPRAVNARHRGTIAAFDLRAEDAGYFSRIGPKLYSFFLARGVLLRPLGNTLYVMPPYCIAPEALNRIYACLKEALDSVAQEEK